MDSIRTPEDRQYIVTCEEASEKEVVLVLSDQDSAKARLTQGWRGVTLSTANGCEAAMVKDGAANKYATH
jgi:hypothetical protein